MQTIGSNYISAQAGAQIPAMIWPVERCAWCWPHLHPDERYPLEWTSTCCAGHAAWMREQARARRKAVAHV